jgi:diaminohydroxyphosphoribosylaminopyrimidine deaminase/5-amino-6-(5-phosphoribosylamino)uracil reductase
VRIVSAGIRRVVAATRDVNPLVAGRGFDYLRNRGVEVVQPVGEDEARRLLAPFFTWVRTGRPFVLAKLALSADGFIGHRDRRVLLSGPAADRYLQRQRAEVDAIAVGADTVLTDDPLLTARGAYRFRPLIRVVFDWRGRVSPKSRLFGTLQSGPVIMVMTAEAAGTSPERVRELKAAGAQVELFAEKSIAAALDRLGQREIVLLLLEGGAGLVEASASFVDRVQLVQTPHRVGQGVRAPSFVTDKSLGNPARTVVLGDDVLQEFDVHRAD